MKTKICKLIAVIAIIFSSILQVNPVHAEEIGEPETEYLFIEEESEMDWESFIYTANTTPYFDDIELFSTLEKNHRVARITCDNSYGYAFVTFNRLDGEVVFCLEPIVEIDYSADYYETTAWWDLSADQQQEIWKAAYYGYAYPGHQNDRYYLASQLLIWMAVDKWYDPYTPDGSTYYDVSYEIDEIRRLSSSASSRPSFNGQTVDLAMDLPVTITDHNNTLSRYNIGNVDGIDISKSGNQLTMTLRNESYAKSASYSPNSSGGFGTPIVFKANGSQTVMKVRPYDPAKPFSLNFNWGNGNGKLVKMDEDGNGVPNVQFEVAKDQYFEDSMGIYTTGNDSAFIFDDVKARSYYVREISAPEQYVVDSTIRKIDVYPNQTATIKVEDEFVKGKVNLQKKDDQTKELLVGAVYGVYNESNEKLQELIIQANGEATSDFIRFGRYYVKEELAPNGYVIDTETKHWFNIRTHQEVIELEAFDVMQRGKITIEKVDSELYDGAVDSSITDFDGNGTQGDGTLAGATYGLYAKEDISHPDKKTGIITYNETIDDNYEIKLDKGTDLHVFNDPAKAGTLLATAKTDEEGQIVFSHLLLGEYFIKELEPSEGYLLDMTQYDVSLEYAGQEKEISTARTTVFETIKRQAFELFKGGHVANTSTNAKPLEGVHFEVKLESDIQTLMNDGMTLQEAKQAAPLYDELITDVEGKATSIELPYGVYRVMETIPSVDYSTAEDFFVTITEDSRTPQDYSNNVVINEVFTAYLKLVKQDAETGKTVLLKNTTFKVKTLEDTIFNGKAFKAGEYLNYFSWDISNGFTTDTWKTDETGTVLLGEKLSAGTYQLDEIHAPYGYVLDTKPVEFTITNSAPYEVADDGNPIISVIKTDKSAKGLIEIYKYGDVLTGIETDAEGNIRFIYEKKFLDNAEFKIFANEDIYSADNQGDLIYAKDEEIQTITSKQGVAKSDEFPLGEYKVVESKAPNGFVLSTDVKVVRLSYQDETVSLVVEDEDYINVRPTFEIDMTKMLEKQEIFINDEAYKDVIFTVYAEEDILDYQGNVIVTANSKIVSTGINQDGRLNNIPDLPFGKYILKETATNSQYLLDETEYEFTVEYKGEHISSYTIMIGQNGQVDNELARGVIKVQKVDKDNDESLLKDVSFNISIHEDMSDVFATVKTNENGLAIFDELELGTYYIQEAEQVDGYIINDTIYKVEVKVDGDVLGITCENTPTEVKFSKQDQNTGNELSGATLQVIDKETGVVVDEWVSTDTPHIIKYLVEGREYIMKETKAPSGYKIAENIIFVAKHGETIVMKDKLIPPIIVPNTGDNSKVSLWGGMTVASGLLMIILFLIKKKEEVEE